MTTRTFRLTFDRDAAIRYVTYGRMSSDLQNPDSPQRQLDTIRETLIREGRNWVEVKSYVDSGISGKFTTRRPGIMQLLEDIDSGQVQCDAVIVDTPERIGRNEDVLLIRRFLAKKGVVILDALSRFRDPTTRDGRILSLLADIQGEDENLKKSHMVSNGKKATVKKKLWPGGTPPTGYMLEACGIEKRKTKEVTLKRLVPKPATASFVQRCFELADVNGWGSTRIAQELNADDTIPDEVKPIFSNTVDRILTNKIYKGVFEWGRRKVSIIDDIRSVETNRTEHLLIVNDYCEPLVSVEQFDRVQKLLDERRRICDDQPDGADAGQCRPGRALKYPLSGLVRCSGCGHAMVASKRKRYRDAKYRCPYITSGICTNKTAVPEPWLHREVMRLVTTRLFGLATAEPTEDFLSSLLGNPEFSEFLGLVNAELERLECEQPSTTQSLTSERDELRKQQEALVLSFRNPNLNADLRVRLEADYSEMESRISEITSILSRTESSRSTVESACQPEAVAGHLQAIAETLTSENASAANLEFARVIDRIMVDCDGQVHIRMCKFSFLLPTDFQPAKDTCNDADRSKRLPGRALPTDVYSELRGGMRQDNSFCQSRFEGFGPEWFWEDTLSVPENPSWTELYAVEVARWRLANPCTLDALCERYGKSKRTIYAALNLAKSLGVDATEIDGRTLQGNWARDHAEEVLAFMQEHGLNIKRAALHFSKSTPWIREALKYAQEKSGGETSEKPDSDPGEDRSAA